MKVYANSARYEPQNRYQIHSILKAHWNEKSAKQRRETYGSLFSEFSVVETPNNADIILLPYKWNHYVQHEKVSEVIADVIQLRQYGKPIVLWSEGDYVAQLPTEISDIYLFQLSTDRSNKITNEFGIPPFMDDILQTEGIGRVALREKQPKPKIGFCGQAVSNPLHIMGIALRNALLYLPGHMPYHVPPPINPPQLLRWQILNTLENDPLVETNFIIRRKYWGGSAENKKSVVREEYLANLTDSDYILCVRGTGNFSKRLYETLNWGRIPIFVETDTILPYDFHINWKQYCVWIERNNIQKIGEKVAVFHDKISPSEFKDLQLACRGFWLEYLSRDGFFRHFHKHFGNTL